MKTKKLIAVVTALLLTGSALASYQSWAGGAPKKQVSVSVITQL